MTTSNVAWLLNEEGPLERITVAGLDTMQKAVRGQIEALRVPPQDERAYGMHTGVVLTVYGNEEGKFHPECKPNMAATDYMMRVLMPGDFIRGPLLFLGLDTTQGESVSVPNELPPFLKLVLSEAGRLPLVDKVTKPVEWTDD